MIINLAVQIYCLWLNFYAVINIIARLFQVSVVLKFQTFIIGSNIHQNTLFVHKIEFAMNQQRGLKYNCPTSSFIR